MDDENPIRPHHEAFARAVVTLAREHKMNNIKISFRTSFNNPHRDWHEVEATWQEGRHGAKSRIGMKSSRFIKYPSSDAQLAEELRQTYGKVVEIHDLLKSRKWEIMGRLNGGQNVKIPLFKSFEIHKMEKHEL